MAKYSWEEEFATIIEVLGRHGVGLKKVKTFPESPTFQRAFPDDKAGVDFSERIVYVQIEARLTEALHEGAHAVLGGDPRFHGPEHLSPFFALEFSLFCECGLSEKWFSTVASLRLATGNLDDQSVETQTAIVKNSFALAVAQGLLPEMRWAEIEPLLLAALETRAASNARNQKIMPNLTMSQHLAESLKRLAEKPWTDEVKAQKEAKLRALWDPRKPFRNVARYHSRLREADPNPWPQAWNDYIAEMEEAGRES